MEYKVADDTEARLRAEIEDLKRKVEEQQRQMQHAPPGPAAPAPPSRRGLWLLALVLAILIVIGFLKGYLPHRRNEATLAAEADSASKEVPTVTVVGVERSATTGTLVLPGNIEAVTEAPVLARASGYIKQRYADIGDRVKAGQLLAEVEAPELDQQVNQARAALDQVRAALEQASASLQQGQAQEQLAKVTAERWKNLQSKGVVSRQENDTYQSQWAAAQANVSALEKAVASARSNINAAQANLSRLTDLQGYKSVRAPFAGVITVRNVDVGALVSEASTLLFRIAQTDRLRTYVNVPQSDADSVHVGQVAHLAILDLAGHQFAGTVTRTANALDPATRTLLTEVQVANSGGLLLPGMYAQVDLTTPRKNPPMLIPGDTLVVRSNGPQVGVVGADHIVHFQRLQLGRDFGDKIEVLSGLEPGQQVVVNPGDTVQEGAKVNPAPLREKKRPA
ncbi:MAG TPA: efflux RND transporter periplasmic adaptor subunit [Bryobacteraceae bacterium]|jgi:RND family efflux transporter MFP subunit|nr:efflux RND transporter periplasmic adaptor subunit [Bryobacteraceae bacterium]